MKEHIWLSLIGSEVEAKAKCRETDSHILSPNHPGPIAVEVNV